MSSRVPTDVTAAMKDLRSPGFTFRAGAKRQWQKILDELPSDRETNKHRILQLACSFAILVEQEIASGSGLDDAIRTGLSKTPGILSQPFDGFYVAMILASCWFHGHVLAAHLTLHMGEYFESEAAFCANLRRLLPRSSRNFQ